MIIRTTKKLITSEVPSDHSVILDIGGERLIVGGWGAAQKVQQMLPRVNSVLSLRGRLPDWMLEGERFIPGMALAVKDGQPVPYLYFAGACDWLTHAMGDEEDHVPFICCWMGQSRSVVFASVWLSLWLNRPLVEVLDAVAEQHPDARPHVALLYSAAAFLQEEPDPEWGVYC